jgi:hypothetical protein
MPCRRVLSDGVASGLLPEFRAAIAFGRSGSGRWDLCAVLDLVLVRWTCRSRAKSRCSDPCPPRRASATRDDDREHTLVREHVAIIARRAGQAPLCRSALPWRCPSGCWILARRVGERHLLEPGDELPAVHPAVATLARRVWRAPRCPPASPCSSLPPRCDPRLGVLLGVAILARRGGRAPPCSHAAVVHRRAHPAVAISARRGGRAPQSDCFVIRQRSSKL